MKAFHKEEETSEKDDDATGKEAWRVSTHRVFIPMLRFGLPKKYKERYKTAKK